MSDVTILGKVQIDTTDSAKSINELKLEIKQASQSMKDAKIGSDEYKQAQLQLKHAEDELAQSMSAANSEKDKSSESFGVLKEKLQGLVPGLKGAEGGVTSFSSQLKLLALNPVVLMLTAVVAALAFMYESFTYTASGAKQMQVVFSGMNAVVDVLKERIFQFGRGLLDIVTGNYKEGIKEIGDSFAGVGAQAQAAAENAMHFTAELQKLNKANKLLQIQQADRKVQIAELRESMNDENIATQTKIENATKLREMETEEGKKEYDNMKARFQAQAAIWRSTKKGAEEHKDDILQMQLDLKNKQAEIAMEEANTNRAIKRLKKQEDAADKQAEKEEAEKDKAARENKIAFDEKMLKYSQEEQLASIKDAHEKELKQLEFKTAAELEINKKALTEGKITTAQYHQLSLAEQQAFLTQREALIRKHEDDIRKTEIEFRKQLADIKKQTDSSEETNLRKKELANLKADLEAKTKVILENDKYTADQKTILFQALNIEQKTKEAAINKKFDEEETKAADARALKDITFEMAHNKHKFSELQKMLTQKQAIIDKQYQDELKAANGNAEKIKDIEQKHTEDTEANVEARKALIKAETDARLAAMDSFASTLENGAKLLGEQTAAGKVASLASATISMFTSAQKAYESTIGIPYVGPIIAPINAAIAAGVGLENIQKIASVQVPGGGGGSVPNVSVSSPVSPQFANPTSTTLDNKSIQGIGNAASNAGRAFVLDRDIKDNAERDAILTRRARLG